MTAIIEHHLTTRGTEIDPTATVPLAVFVRYFEHLRWLSIQDPRLGLVELVHDSHFFVVRNQTVAVRRRVGQSVPLRLTTRFLQVGRSTATVLHQAHRTSDGTLVAEARATGAWLGKNRRLARLPDTFRAFAQSQLQNPAPAPSAHDADLPNDDHPAPTRSFTAPAETVHAPLSLEVDAPPVDAPNITFSRYERTHTLIIPPRDLDVFNHVNAATFLGYIDDARHFATPYSAVLRHGWVVRAALFYHREACLGDALNINLWRAPDSDHALAGAITRQADGAALVTTRIDLRPAPDPVTRPES